jgi:hypothetical protein
MPATGGGVEEPVPCEAGGLSCARRSTLSGSGTGVGAEPEERFQRELGLACCEEIEGGQG